MRDKILQALHTAGHALTLPHLQRIIGDSDSLPYVLERMEETKDIICHRSSGSAGIPKGEIVLITLRPDGH